jgi:hypothetical protein
VSGYAQARADIADALARYCCGVDRGDEELIRSAYFDDAVEDRVGYHGGVEGFIAYVREWVSVSFEVTHHQLGSTYVRFEGNVAMVETYFTAHHVTVPGEDGRQMMVVGGRYLDRFERRSGQWRIAHRTGLRDWSEIRPMVESNLPMRSSERWRADPS